MKPEKKKQKQQNIKKKMSMKHVYNFFIWMMKRMEWYSLDKIFEIRKKKSSNYVRRMKTGGIQPIYLFKIETRLFYLKLIWNQLLSTFSTSNYNIRLCLILMKSHIFIAPFLHYYFLYPYEFSTFYSYFIFNVKPNLIDGHKTCETILRW